MLFRARGCTAETFTYTLYGGDRKELLFCRARWSGCEFALSPVQLLAGELFFFGAQATRCGKMINCCGGFPLSASGAVWISPFRICSMAVYLLVLLPAIKTASFLSSLSQ